MGINNGNFGFKMREGDCLLCLSAVPKLRWWWVGVRCVRKKQKKSNDQRALATRYYQIKELGSLDMKYYLVAG